MPYVDYEYYKNNYLGGLVDETDFPKLSLRASEMIENICSYKIGSLELKSPFIQDKIRKATCAQIDFIEINGGIDFLDEVNTSSVTLGKFSFSGPSNEFEGNSKISNRVYEYLWPTGLLYRGM